MKWSFLQRNKRQAFTLVELLVTITIFVIMSGVVLFSQTKFNSSILLTNLAYDLALTVRQAQTFGVNIKQFDLGGIAVFNPYGVHIQMVNDRATQFFLFTDITEEAVGNPDFWSVDINDDGQPDNVPESAIVTYTSCEKAEGCVTRQSLKRGNYISGVRRIEADGTVVALEAIDIMFVRPNPEAIIWGEVDDEVERYDSVVICLSEPDGVEHKAVEVRQTGQIEVVREANVICE